MYDIYKEVKERHGFIELYCDNDAYVEKEDIPVFYNTKMGKDFCDSLLSTDVKALSYDLLLRRGTMRIKYNPCCISRSAGIESNLRLKPRKMRILL